MNNYKNSKEKLNKIRQEYTCKGDIIFTTAMQMVVEHGAENFNDDEWFNKVVDGIDERHNKAEAEGKILWITRDFEKAIVNCARAASEVSPYNLMVYIQREMYLSNGLMDGEPNYDRAIEIIRNCLCYAADRYGTYPEEESETLYKFREMDLTDEEIDYFGWGYLLKCEEEEE